VDHNAALRTQIEVLETKNAVLKATVAPLNDSYATISAEYEKSSNLCAKLEAKRDELEAERVELEAKRDELEAERDVAQASVASIEKDRDEQIRQLKAQHEECIDELHVRIASVEAAKTEAAANIRAKISEATDESLSALDPLSHSPLPAVKLPQTPTFSMSQPSFTRPNKRTAEAEASQEAISDAEVRLMVSRSMQFCIGPDLTCKLCADKYRVADDVEEQLDHLMREHAGACRKACKRQKARLSTG
jgi:hypothetical protein